MRSLIKAVAMEIRNIPNPYPKVGDILSKNIELPEDLEYDGGIMKKGEKVSYLTLVRKLYGID
jgi:hypothetical protein